MSTSYCLSIVVYGPGDDPNHRSHWAFAFHRPGATIGNIYHVTLLDLDHLIYQFELREGVTYQSRSSEGFFTLAYLTPEQYVQATTIISQESAPRNGQDRCQDWVLSCIISLEVDEILAPGTSNWIQSLVGSSAADVACQLDDRWIPTQPQDNDEY